MVQVPQQMSLLVKGITQVHLTSFLGVVRSVTSSIISTQHFRESRWSWHSNMWVAVWCTAFSHWVATPEQMLFSSKKFWRKTFGHQFMTLSLTTLWLCSRTTIQITEPMCNLELCVILSIWKPKSMRNALHTSTYMEGRWVGSSIWIFRYFLIF